MAMQLSPGSLGDLGAAAFASQEPDDEVGFLRSILDSQSEMVCRFRGDGVILYANRAYADALGASPDDLEGRSLWAFVSPEDSAAVEAMLDDLTPAQPTATIENRFITAAGERWTRWTNRALAFDTEGRWSVAQSTGSDITEQRRAEAALAQSQARLRLLVQEMNHRVKNSLAVAQSLVFQTVQDRDDRAILADRLSALGRAHGLLMEAEWASVDLAAIVDATLAPFDRAPPAKSRFDIDGAPAPLNSNAAVCLALALYELATNAVKHGALSTVQGRVAVSWRFETGGGFELVWRESGGPAARADVAPGFGLRLIERVVRELGASAAVDLSATGLTCRIRAEG